MSTNKCPHCGEYIQKNSLTCQKCFKEIPRDQPMSPEYVIKEDKKERSGKPPTVAVLLAVIPPFFGLLGLGMIYLDHRDKNGYWILAIGLALFLPFLALLYIMSRSGFLSAVLLFIVLVIIFLLYASAAAAAFIETVFGSVFRILKF